MTPNNASVEILFYDTADSGGDLSALQGWHGIDTTVREEGVAANVRHCSESDVAQIGKWLGRYRPVIVHLVAHGRADDGHIMAQDSYGEYWVAAEALAASFAGRGIELATVRVCNGGPLGKALSAHVKCVVAASSPFASFSTTSTFFRAFYRSLAQGSTTGMAFEQGLAASKMRNLTEDFALYGEANLVPIRPAETPAPEKHDPEKVDVCIVASSFAAHHVDRIRGLLAPLVVMHASDDTRPDVPVDEWADTLIDKAKVVMVLHEPRLRSTEGASHDKKEQAWSVFDHVLTAISRKLDNPGRRLFPVFLDGRPPRHEIYFGLRRLVGLDVEREGGLAAAMAKVPALVKRAEADLKQRS